jgi:hypothetical protein
MPNKATPIEQTGNTAQTFGSRKAICRKDLPTLAAELAHPSLNALQTGHS